MLIEFNTFQKHSADSKLSTNRYLMSVAAVFQKLLVKVDVTLISIETKLVYIWISKFHAIIAAIY